VERQAAALMTSIPSLPIIDFSMPFRVASFFVYYATLALVIVFDHMVFRVRIVGRRNLKSDRGILVSNHTLYLDPGLISHAIAPRRTYYSAMEKTFRVKVLGTYIRLLGAFPLPDENPIQRVRTPLRRALRERGLVHFFPEGELHHLNQGIRRFSDGAFFFAALLNVPVIPIVIVLRPRRWAEAFGIPFPPRVTLRIAPPFHPSQFGITGARDREGIATMRDAVRERMVREITVPHDRGRRPRG
jgi:1-acyl-sn-glycerol-3-phosphate acyltransferase